MNMYLIYDFKIVAYYLIKSPKKLIITKFKPIESEHCHVKDRRRTSCSTQCAQNRAKCHIIVEKIASN